MTDRQIKSLSLEYSYGFSNKIIVFTVSMFMLALSRMSDAESLDELIVFTVSIFMLLYPGRQMPVRQQFFSIANFEEISGRKIGTIYKINNYLITSPSADMVRLGVKVQVQVEPKKFCQKFFQLTLPRCVPSFKSLAQV